MKFKSATDDGMVVIEATAEQKQSIVDFLNHFFVEKLKPVMEGSKTKKPLLDDTTDADLTFNENVEELIEKVKPRVNNKTNILRLHKEDFWDLDSLTIAIKAQMGVTDYGFSQETFDEIEFIADDVSNNHDLWAAR